MGGMKTLSRVARRLVAAFALVALAACSSCAHIPAPIKDFGACLSKEMTPQVGAIITDVETALASGNFIAVLTTLGGRVGFAVVDCAVAEVGQNSKVKHAAAPSDQISATKADHADAWLRRS